MANEAKKKYVKEFKKTGKIENSKNLSDTDDKICSILYHSSCSNKWVYSTGFKTPALKLPYSEYLN